MPVVHVIPVADLIEHECVADSCVCGPALQFVEDDDGRTSGALVTHHSLDGRELYEGDE